MVSLSWNNVLAWRMEQHHLLRRAPAAYMVDVVSDICGVQAQVMSSAEMAIWARVDGLRPDDISKALWQDKSLVKSWFYRGTLHIIASQDMPVVVGALSSLRHFTRASWQKYFNVTLDELETMIAALQDILTSVGITREEMTVAVVERTGQEKLGETLRSGWGSVLKPASFRGVLCYGENKGKNITFARPDLWLNEWKSLETETAQIEMARRFLKSYAPSTPEDFGRWFAFEPAAAKKIFKTLGDEIQAIEVEGWKAWALKDSVTAMQGAEPVDCIRLLPAFDQYVIAFHRQSETILPKSMWSKVSRAQGWISPVVLVNGKISGIWDYEQKRDQTQVTVEMFTSADEHTHQGIEAELDRLKPIIGEKIEIRYQ